MWQPYGPAEAAMHANVGVDRSPGGHRIWLLLGSIILWLVLTVLVTRLLYALLDRFIYLLWTWFFFQLFRGG